MVGETPFPGGPIFTAALLCEKVLTESDGTKSAIRIVDRINRQRPGMEMEPFEFDLALLIRFKSGSARGPMTLKVQILKPSGESYGPILGSVLFEGEEDRGVDVVMHMKTRYEMTGIYWYVISLNDVEITRIPMRIVYIPLMTPLPPGGNPPPPDRER
jgi:hypothetical protein